mmetsp:Transcript_17171/g.31300  ORF Transcript_17171/g.31300 Transcript_17171/m.31300 type:complete len:258 (+) Transcript_17171:39-812(+)
MHRQHRKRKRRCSLGVWGIESSTFLVTRLWAKDILGPKYLDCPLGSIPRLLLGSPFSLLGFHHHWCRCKSPSPSPSPSSSPPVSPPPRPRGRWRWWWCRLDTDSPHETNRSSRGRSSSHHYLLSRHSSAAMAMTLRLLGERETTTWPAPQGRCRQCNECGARLFPRTRSCRGQGRGRGRGRGHGHCCHGRCRLNESKLVGSDYYDGPTPLLPALLDPSSRPLLCHFARPIDTPPFPESCCPSPRLPAFHLLTFHVLD